MARKSSMLAGGGIWAGTPVNGTVARAPSAAGTTTADALHLTADVNEITTCAAGAGAKVPAMEAGDSVAVYNFGANACKLYPTTGGTMNGGAADAEVSIPAGKSAVVHCFAPGAFGAVVGA